MYLNKKQAEAIEMALEALDMCLRFDIDPEKSAFATDALADMKRKDRTAKQNFQYKKRQGFK